MARIYVAEDSPTQAADIRQRLVSKGFEVEVFPNGVAALEAVKRDQPDLVLTDLDMPEMDGLELVESIREQFSSVPVVLMTAFGSEEIAVQALRRGAASYVPKKLLDRDLLETIDAVLTLSRVAGDQERLGDYLAATESQFNLDNDPALVMPVVAHVQEAMQAMQLGDENERIRAGVALEEAIRNAIYHGNLELSTAELRDAYHLEDGGKSYFEFIEARRAEPLYRDRRVHVDARVSRDEAVCVVRDEGPGFDHGAVAAAVPSLQGDGNRGLLLINTFMNDVKFNSSGNEITLVKRRDN